MKMLMVITFVFSTTVFAQTRISNTVSVATPVETVAPTVSMRYNCCLHKDNGNSNVCQIKFVHTACMGNWQPVKNHKLCLAKVPGYDSSQPIASTVNLNQAYVLNPCPF